MQRAFALLIVLLAYQASAQRLISSTPFELFGDHIFISLSVDDSDPIDFIFDSGDGLAVIDLDIAKKLGLKPDHKSTKTSAQGSVSGALIEHNKVELNDVKLEDIELYSTDLSRLEQSIGRNIDGIIGYDLLKNYVIKIDYMDMMFKLYDPSSFAYEGYGQGFKFKLNSYIPHITCKVTLNNGETFEEEFFINTGAGTTMDFNTIFANKNGVIDKTGDHYSYPVSGLGTDETLHYEGRVMNFSLGTVDFENLPVGISQAKHGIQHHKKVAGIVGNSVLRRFNLTFDYKRSMVYFEANENSKDPFLVNASGMHLQLDPSGSMVLVHRVFEGGPASSAGIQAGAQLLEINGEQVSDYSLPEVRKRLKSTNQKVKVKVLQNGLEKEFDLDLTSLI